MALMDKMYIKLDQKEVLYKPWLYQRRGRGQNQCNFRQSNNWRRNRSFSREHGYDNSRGYGRGIILEEVVFKAGLVIIFDRIVIEVERIEGHRDSLDQEKEE